MVAAILYQLTRNVSEEEIANTPFAPYFVDHTTGIYPVAASGVPFDMKYVGIKGDVITDLNEDLAADAAILQMQPLSKNRRKPLKYKNFSHLGKTLKNRYPAII